MKRADQRNASKSLSMNNIEVGWVYWGGGGGGGGTQ